MSALVHAGERIDDLGRAGLRIIQRPDGTAFGLDAVLVAHFARVPKAGRVVDLGAGTGVIALLLTALSDASAIEALELDPSLADMATRSVELNGLGGRVRVLHGDIRDVAALYPAQSFTTVISNPPYFPVGSGQVSPSPVRAAGRSEMTCTIDDLCVAARHLLGRRGKLYFVYRPERLVDAMAACRRHAIEPKRAQFVQPAHGKRPSLVLIEAAPGARPGLVVEPTLMVREGPGYSEEIRRIYGENGI